MIFLPQIRQPTGTKPDIQSDIIPVVLPQLHSSGAGHGTNHDRNQIHGFFHQLFLLLFSGKVIINHRLSAGCPEAEGNMVVL